MKLLVAYDKDHKAEGDLFWDDGESLSMYFKLLYCTVMGYKRINIYLNNVEKHLQFLFLQKTFGRK